MSIQSKRDESQWIEGLRSAKRAPAVFHVKQRRRPGALWGWVWPLLAYAAELAVCAWLLQRFYGL